MGSVIKPPVTVDPTAAMAIATLAVAGATIPAGYAAAFGGPVALPFDGQYATPNFSFGALAGGDFRGYHDGSTTSLRNLTGGLRIWQESTSPIDINPSQATGSFRVATPGSGLATFKLNVNANGVTVGTGAPTPTTGRAFAVHTTFHGATPSLYVDDTNGSVRINSASATAALMLGNNDTASTNQIGLATTRGYSTSVPISAFRYENQSAAALLDIGRGESGAGISPITQGRLYATSAVAAGTGNSRLCWTNAGVTAGVGALSPTAGRAFAVHTTAHGATPSLRVDDADGHVKVPNDNQFLSVGASGDLYQYHNGTNSYVVNNVGHLFVRAVAGSGYGYCDFTNAWTFRKDSTEVAAFKPDGVLRLAPQASPPADVTAGNLYIDTSNVLHIADGTVWAPV